MRILLLIILFFTIELKSQVPFFVNKVQTSDTNTYVTIGTQTWMQYNLKAPTTGVPNITDSATWVNLTTPAYCYFKNDSATYYAKYGRIYNWYAATSANICPAGTHVPTNNETITLSNYLGGDDIAGGHMKEIGTTNWETPNTGADNSSGFNGTPTGIRSYGQFREDLIHKELIMWNSNEFSGTSGYARLLVFNNDNYLLSAGVKQQGFSVRCIKD